MAANNFKFDPDATMAGVAATRAPGSSSSGTAASGGFPVYVPGTVLCDRYEIIQLLGEGGMGSVYKATDRETERLVALKTIRPEMANNADMLARFKQELILARQVTHRNVIRIFDIGEAAGTKFITMEYVEGEDLRSLLQEKGKFTPAEAVEVMQQVCRALEAAHAEGVIHRDLKPQNIMRDSTGRIVVMDFGLARTLESSMTQTGALIGTMDYMSPEQALGSNVDARSDLFAIGLIFYELLSGKAPYQAESAIASLLKRSQERAVPVSEIDTSVPRPLSNIVAKCLERNREQRYLTATEILRDLDAFQGGSVVRVAPSASGIKYPRKIWYAVGGVVLAIGLIAGALGLRHRAASTASVAQTSPVAPALSLAIVPFRNASGDRSLDWLGSSIAETLTTDVGQSAQLHVVSNDNVHQLMRDLRIAPDTELDSPTLSRFAQFSNADQLVWGRYTKFGNQIRLDATLQDLKQQRSIPVHAEAANENDLLAAIDRLAQAIRGNLAVSASVVEELKSQALKPSTQSLEALRRYHNGLELAHEGKNSEAVPEFEASIKADQNFALAYAKLGESYSRLGYGDKAEEYSQKAVLLGQQLPEQERYRILASQALVSNDNKKAIEYYENLAKVSPNDSEIQLTLAQLYENVGSYDTARDALQKLLVREPKYGEALVALAHVQGERREPQSALEYLNRALALAVELNNDGLRARGLYETGYIYRLLNKPEEALRNYQEALAIRRRLGQKAGIAQTLAEIAEIQYAQGKPDAAVASYKEALQLQRDIGDKTYLSHTLLNLGGMLSDRGQYDEALKYLKESLQMQRELHNENYEAMCLNNIGNVYLSTGRYDDAMTYYQQALDSLQKLKATGEIPAVQYNLGDTSSRMGQYDQAISYYLRGLEQARSAGNKQLVATGSFNLGRVFDYQGRYAAALSSLDDAVKSYRELQDRTASMADALNGYGHTLTELGKNDEGKKALDEALALGRETNSEIQIAQSLNFQADRMYYAGDLKGAESVLKEALQVATHSKDRETTLLVKVSAARSTLEQGQARKVIPELKQLAQEADTLGLKHSSVECSLYLAKALIDTRDYRGAEEQADRARRSSEKFGFKLAMAQSHFLLGEIARLTGKTPESTSQYQQARQILQDISNDAHADTFLKRNDLREMMATSAH